MLARFIAGLTPIGVNGDQFNERRERLTSCSGPRPIALAARILGLLLVAMCALACRKSVPASTKPLVDAIRPTAESIATAAATACAAEFAKGRFVVSGGACSAKVLPGETMMPPLPSPAKGSPLETSPNVIDVLTTCYVPTSAPGANPSTSCGTTLDALRKPPAKMSYQGVPDRAESSCAKTPDNCEEITVPSRYATTADAVDLRIVRPVIGGPTGATVEVLVAISAK